MRVYNLVNYMNLVHLALQNNCFDLQVNNLLYWCLPADAHVSANEPEVHVSNQPRTGHCIVCPIPMSRGSFKLMEK